MPVHGFVQSRMNILFVDQFGDLGGAQLCMLDLMPAIVEEGWRVIAAVPPGPFAERLRRSGAKVIDFDAGTYHSGSKTAADAVRYIRKLPRLAAALNSLQSSHEADVIYVNGPRLMPPVALARPRTPVLFHSHSQPPAGLSRRLVGLAIRRSRATVVAVSRHIAGTWRRYVAADRLHIIPNGVPDLRLPAANRDALRIGLIGRIAPQKGISEFVRAARILTPQIANCRFVICGEPRPDDAPYAAFVRRSAAELPIEFLGHQDDIAGVMAGITVLVVASREEGFGRTVIEGFSAGVPVVAFPTGGVPESIEDNQTGFLVPAPTAEALASKLATVLERPQILAAVAQKAREKWQLHYDVHRYRRSVIDLLTHVAAAGKTRQ
ncbi:MAG TPA: glycosyltransferase family 4 protein [Bryobacteraceae bacterium]|nr:glycosyltransferase family 4 protein [Bryobacteraceae bacterium]